MPASPSISPMKVRRPASKTASRALRSSYSRDEVVESHSRTIEAIVSTSSSLAGRIRIGF
jgi:hypothetical protein